MLFVPLFVEVVFFRLMFSASIAIVSETMLLKLPSHWVGVRMVRVSSFQKHNAPLGSP